MTSKILSYFLSYNSSIRDGTGRDEILTGQDL
jgi:hypothetical protein